MTSGTAEQARLAESTEDRPSAWKLIGPYLSERAWGTVREDYSADGKAWQYFPYEHGRSRAYRWNEDGLAGICDLDQRMCFALAFWNGRDPFLKERIFGLSGPEGNHGEDAKEYWWYPDATPTASWLRWRYHYPQGEFPYARLREENARRGKQDREFELADTGIFERTAIGRSPQSTRRPHRGMCASASACATPGPKPPSCMCCRRYGSGTDGPGKWAPRDQGSVPTPVNKRARSPRRKSSGAGG